MTGTDAIEGELAPVGDQRFAKRVPSLSHGLRERVMQLLLALIEGQAAHDSLVRGYKKQAGPVNTRVVSTES